MASVNKVQIVKCDIETSKDIVYKVMNRSFTLLTIVVLVWAVTEKQEVAALAGVVSAPIPIALAFYYWKARAENRIKLLKTHGMDTTDENY